MGQKLVSIKFNAGSSPNLWNLKYKPDFKIEVSENGTDWNFINIT